MLGCPPVRSVSKLRNTSNVSVLEVTVEHFSYLFNDIIIIFHNHLNYSAFPGGASLQGCGPRPSFL